MAVELENMEKDPRVIDTLEAGAMKVEAAFKIATRIFSENQTLAPPETFGDLMEIVSMILDQTSALEDMIADQDPTMSKWLGNG